MSTKVCTKPKIKNEKYEKARRICKQALCESQKYALLYMGENESYSIAWEFYEVPLGVNVVEFVHYLE